MKRLLITSTDLMMIQFLVPHVLYLRENGFDVEVACSNVGGRINEVIEQVGKDSVHIVRASRNPLKPSNLSGLKDLQKIINSGKYDIVWTNEPVMGILTRLAAKKSRKSGTKVVYMVHGFHFYKGAPKINWFLWYPIEKAMAKYCDMLITVNNEDYMKAQEMPYKRVKYVHGIGINTDRLSKSDISNNIRDELNLPKDAKLLIAVGELNKNKNQQIIIQALSKVTNSQCHLLLCGKGDERANLEALTQRLNITERVHFLGYRKDVVDIIRQSDIFLMSSFREGLPVASLEAMYCGIPLITSKCRGLEDIMLDEETKFLCDPTDSSQYANAIDTMLSSNDLQSKICDKNTETVQAYLIANAQKEVFEKLREF